MKGPDENPKNMLTQVAQTINYKTDIDLPAEESEIPGLLINYNFNIDDIIGSKVITWSNQFDLEESTWRQNDTYTFIGDATDYQEFTGWIGDPDDFIENTTTGYNIWKRTSNIEKYDRYSHPTEEIGIDGVYTSAIYGYEDALPTAIISNAKVSECGFTSFEDQDICGWNHSNQVIDYDNAHTGERTVLVYLDNGTEYGPCKNFYVSDSIDTNKGYLFSAWVKGPASSRIKICINNASPFDEVYCSGLGVWEYLEVMLTEEEVNENLTEPNDYIRIFVENNSYTEAYFDDLRFHPIDATMSTYTYDPLTWKLTSITDANNVSSYFEYDDAGRLVGIYDQDKHLRKEYDYEFGRNQE